MRRPTYCDSKPSYRAVNSPGLHLHHDFRKVRKPWPPVILLGSEYHYTKPQDKKDLQSASTNVGAIYHNKQKTSFLLPRAKIAENTTEGSLPADDSNPYRINRWWIHGEGKEQATGGKAGEKEDGDEGGDEEGDEEGEEKAGEENFCEASSDHVSASADEEVYSKFTQLHHPRPERSTSAEVIHLEIQANMQTPSLNFAATPPLDLADEVRPCIRSSRVLLERALRLRFKDEMVQEHQVDLIDLSEGAGVKGDRHTIPNISHVDPIVSTSGGGLEAHFQVDLLGCSPSPRFEAQPKNNITVPREPQVDLISFSLSTGILDNRTITPHYQKTDLLSMDPPPFLRFQETNDTPEEKSIFLNFRTDDSGTSFVYQPPQRTPLKQTLIWGLLFLFLAGLTRLISTAEGVELWMLVVALGLGAGVLTR